MSKTIIECMCDVVEAMSDGSNRRSSMPIDNVGKASVPLGMLAKKLSLTRMQALILTACMQHAQQYHFTPQEVADDLDVSYLRFLTYNPDLNVLRRRGFITTDRDGDYRMPGEVVDALRDDHLPSVEQDEGLDAAGLLTRIRKMLSMLRDGKCEPSDVWDKVDKLMEGNPDNSVARAFAHFDLGWRPERLFLCILVYHYYYKEDDNVIYDDLDDYFGDDAYDVIVAKIRTESLESQRKGIVKFVMEDGVCTKRAFHLSRDAKERIFADVGFSIAAQNKKVRASHKLAPSSIVEKPMFYNATELRQVSRLRRILSQERFDGVRSQMHSKGMRTGFTCLFYGAPGTGKTETVYQIARETGRDLYVVDVARIKSCWVGESEKNIREVFSEYRSCVEQGGVLPILVFNEADAIFGIRQEGAERAVDKMENSIQNIILQEMEDLDGILIATTNLTTNLDKAFERRFLYKIRFDKPCPEAKRSIWKAMIPELSDSEAATLAEGYDFSGGQIENIARKRTIHALIDEAEPSFEQIREYCGEELIGDRPYRPRVGF